MDGRSARISWKAPDRNSWNGELKGYYIGYKISGSRDQYLYKTIDKQFNAFIDQQGLQHNRDGRRKNSSSSSSLLMLQLTNESSSSNIQQHLDHHSSSSEKTVVTLRGLKPLTEYIILVQAYNSFGAGPQSDGLLIKTTEDGTLFSLSPSHSILGLEALSWWSIIQQENYPIHSPHFTSIHTHIPLIPSHQTSGTRITQC